MRRNLLLGLAMTALFFLLLEGGLRLTGLVSTDALRSPDIETLDSIPGLFDPGQDLVDRIKPSVPYHIHINSLGFRGREFPRAKPAGALRVLCVGDSYTFGAHVQDEEAFPARLDRLLNERRTDGSDARPPVDVINAGANGFTITDELVYLRDKGLALDPDIVLLNFSQNDIRDLSRTSLWIDAMREHARLKSAFLLGPILKFLQHTALFNGMQQSAAWVRVKIRKAREAEIKEESPELWRVYRRTLGELSDLLAGHGARLVLVVWPSADQIAGIEPLDPQTKLAGFAGELGIEMIDLTPEFAALASGGAPAFLLPYDGHPSPRGQDAAARAIARRLEIGILAASDPAR